MAVVSTVGRLNYINTYHLKHIKYYECTMVYIVAVPVLLYGAPHLLEDKTLKIFKFCCFTTVFMSPS